MERLHTTIERAILVSVQEINLPGIARADLRSVAVLAEQLQRVAAQLEQHGCSKIRLPAKVELYLRISSANLLRVVESTEYEVVLQANGDDFSATASTDKDWAVAWERSMEPIRQAALRFMKEDVWNIDATLTEDSYTFQAAMVLLTSELVGPYV